MDDVIHRKKEHVFKIVFQNSTLFSWLHRDINKFI